MYEIYCPKPGDRVRFEFDANNYIEAVLVQDGDGRRVELRAGNCAWGYQGLRIVVEPSDAPIGLIGPSTHSPVLALTVPIKTRAELMGLGTALGTAKRDDRDSTVHESGG